MIKFEDVTKVYKEGASPALEDVSFNIERGEFVFLVGSSGSGKSTLLSLILRAERLNDGKIYVAGRDLDTLTSWRVPEYRQSIGVVFQNFRLLNNKTVYENVAFALQVIGKNRHEIAKLVPEALELVGLSDKSDRFPDQLSGGERQRVAIARAFVNRPLIIMADEPTGNLDPATSMEIMRVFEMINQLGTTILMATHSEEIVNHFAKRVIELNNGTLVRDEENAQYISRISPEDDFGGENSVGEQAAEPAKATAETPDTAPAIAIEAISTEDSQASVDQNTQNQTVRIAKMPRKVNGKAVGRNTTNADQVNMPSSNEFALDALEDNSEKEITFENFFKDNNPNVFNSDAFDFTQIREQDVHSAPSQTMNPSETTEQTDKIEKFKPKKANQPSSRGDK